jgi:hypothetical protein
MFRPFLYRRPDVIGWMRTNFCCCVQQAVAVSETFAPFFLNVENKRKGKQRNSKMS